jgi:hypothetical protein
MELADEVMVGYFEKQLMLALLKPCVASSAARQGTNLEDEKNSSAKPLGHANCVVGIARRKN